MFYIFVHQLLAVLIRLLFRKQTLGLDNIPPKGGAVLVANHISYIDPPVLATSIPVTRRVYFMAKKELFSIPIFGRIIQALGAFPVQTGTADRRALMHALRILKDQKLLLVFPEGTRNPQLEKKKVYSGGVLLAQKAEVPVIPIGLINTGKILPAGSSIPRFPKLTVNIGKPIKIPPDLNREQVRELTTELMEKIELLISEDPAKSK